MEQAKVLVCGGRDYHDEQAVRVVLSTMHQWRPFDVLIHGDQRGADTLARKWAERNNVKHVAYPADWDHYGNRAGPIRNREMIKEQPDIVVAFPGEWGTNDMIEVAKEQEVPVIDLRYTLPRWSADDIPF